MRPALHIQYTGKSGSTSLLHALTPPITSRIRHARSFWGSTCSRALRKASAETRLSFPRRQRKYTSADGWALTRASTWATGSLTNLSIGISGNISATSAISQGGTHSWSLAARKFHIPLPASYRLPKACPHLVLCATLRRAPSRPGRRLLSPRRQAVLLRRKRHTARFPGRL